MARILFGSVPLYGHINPTIAIAQKLKELGHEVGYACHSEVKDLFDKADIDLLDNFEWGEAISFVSKLVATNKFTWQKKLKKERNISPILFHLDKLPEGVEDFIEVIDNWKPDVCVFDTLFFPGSIAAEIRNIPYASSCPAIIPLPSKDLLPAGLGFSSKKKKMDIKRRLLYQVLKFHSMKNLDFLNEVRQRYNLPATDFFFDSHSPFLYLLYTTEEFDFKRSDLIRQAYFLGPSISDNRGGNGVVFPWEFLVGDEPIVYFSMGTVFGNKKLIQKVIEASLGAPWKLVASITRNLNIDDFKNLPKNVLLKNYVPQLELLKKVNVAISHGGAGTVGEALREGVPLIVIPQMLDQFDAAQRVVESGAGLKLNPWFITSNKIRKAISKLLNDPVYEQNANRIAIDYLKCDAPATAASLILKLAKAKKPLLRPDHIKPTIYNSEIENVLNAL